MFISLKKKFNQFLSYLAVLPYLTKNIFFEKKFEFFSRFLKILNLLFTNKKIPSLKNRIIISERKRKLLINDLKNNLYVHSFYLPNNLRSYVYNRTNLEKEYCSSTIKFLNINVVKIFLTD